MQMYYEKQWLTYASFVELKDFFFVMGVSIQMSPFKKKDGTTYKIM